MLRWGFAVIISAWSDKGGQGKTTLAVNVAACLKVPLIDLDPQADAARWAARVGHPCTAFGEETEPEDVAKQIAPKFTSEDLVVVDCPPGHHTRSLLGMSLSRLTIIPVKSGDADLAAFGRAIERVQEIRQRGNPDLEVGVVLNFARGTRWSHVTHEALSRKTNHFHYLGEIGLRQSVEDSYRHGKTLLSMGGATAHEFRSVLQHLLDLNIFNIIP
jgi:cellulose biosynthesis protein BcsQ